MRCGPLRLEARVANLAAASTLVGDCADRAGLDARMRFAVLLSLEEAFVNVCRYAYPGGSGDVEVTCEHRTGVFVLELADTGAAFDPRSVPLPDTSADLDKRQMGGLGIHFIRSLADGVTYRRDGDRNTLRMEFPPAAGTGEG